MARPKKPSSIDLSFLAKAEHESQGRVQQNPELIGDGWFVKNIRGEVYGPYSWNDIENFVVQKKITLESMLLHKMKSKGQWVAVARVPKLVELLSHHKKTVESLQSVLAMPQVASGAQTAPAAREDFSRASSVTILISAIANIVVGLLWASLCFGLIFAIPLWILCFFEFMHYGKRDSLTLKKYHANTTNLGIAEIILGLVNTITLVCGIVTLLNRPGKD